MNTITLLNGIKSMFSSLGAKTSDSNYAVGLYDKTSAEPKGIMAMSSLASVLGGVTIGINTNQDLNDFTTPGVLYVAASGSISTSLSHRPSGLIEAFMMMYFRNSPGQTQIIVTTWSAFKLYKRSYDNGWQKWQLVTGTEVEYAE